MSHNNLGFLPSEVGQLAFLQELWIVNVQLLSLPPEICNLVHLEKLGAGFNKIKSLPDNFADLKSIKWLNFANNQLSSLPNNFPGLVSLMHLNLSENQFSEFPENLNGLMKLEFLSLRSNFIHSLDGNSVNNLPNLSRVDLRENKLSLLPRSLERLHIFVTGERQVCKDVEDKSLQKLTEVRKRQKATKT